MNPSTVSHFGSWNVTVTLTDTASITAVYSFMVKVINLPPTYVSTATYTPVDVHLNSIKVVTIFPNYDPEGGPVYVYFSLSNTTKSSFNFMLASDNSQITIAPTSFNEVGTHVLPIILIDG